LADASGPQHTPRGNHPLLPTYPVHHLVDQASTSRPEIPCRRLGARSAFGPMSNPHGLDREPSSLRTRPSRGVGLGPGQENRWLETWGGGGRHSSCRHRATGGAGRCRGLGASSIEVEPWQPRRLRPGQGGGRRPASSRSRPCRSGRVGGYCRRCERFRGWDGFGGDDLAFETSRAEKARTGLCPRCSGSPRRGLGLTMRHGGL